MASWREGGGRSAVTPMSPATSPMVQSPPDQLGPTGGPPTSGGGGVTTPSGGSLHDPSIRPQIPVHGPPMPAMMMRPGMPPHMGQMPMMPPNFRPMMMPHFVSAIRALFVTEFTAVLVVQNNISCVQINLYFLHFNLIAGIPTWNVSSALCRLPSRYAETSVRRARWI